MESLKVFAPQLKRGAILICSDEDSQSEDLGMSGIVLEGRKDLILGEKYEVIDWDLSACPQKKQKDTVWVDDSQEDFYKVLRYWILLTVKDIKRGRLHFRCWYHLFKH